MVKTFAKLLCLLIAVIAISCDSNRIDSPRQLLAKELAILEEFLDSVPTGEGYEGNELSFKDLWTSEAVDTIDNSLDSNVGIIYFEMITGSGDKVAYGKEVGYRYIRYVLARDTVENANWFLSASNYNTDNPDTYVVGGSSSAPAGVQEAISMMRKYGKSRVIVPSTQGGGSYQTSVYDLEITYLSK